MNITTNADVVAAALRKFAKELNYASRDALKRTAGDIINSEERRVKNIFDKPVRATQKAFRISEAATLKRLTTTVSVKDKLGKGNAPSQWLRAEVFGGRRRMKRNEKALTHAIGWRGIAIPAFDYPRNGFGNVPGGVYRKAIKSLSAKDGKFFRGRRRQRNVIFEHTDKADNGKYRPFLILARTATYKKKFDFYKVAERKFSRVMAKNLRRGIAGKLKQASLRR